MAYTQKMFLAALCRAGLVASAIIALAFFTVQAMDREAAFECRQLAAFKGEVAQSDKR